jgi:hypothetical protein
VVWSPHNEVKCLFSCFYCEFSQIFCIEVQVGDTHIFKISIKYTRMCTYVCIKCEVSQNVTRPGKRKYFVGVVGKIHFAVPGGNTGLQSLRQARDSAQLFYDSLLFSHFM